MTPTDEEVQELESNGILKDTAAFKIYEDFRKSGVSHKDATRTIIDGMKNLTSTSFDEKTLNNLKYYMSRIKGQMF